MIKENGYTLVNDLQKECVRDSLVLTIKSEPLFLRGGLPPSHSGSAGRIFVSNLKDSKPYEIYPSYCRLSWRKD